MLVLLAAGALALLAGGIKTARGRLLDEWIDGLMD
jgi:hypothetical protein